MNPEKIYLHWLDKYGLWISKTHAQNILGNLPFDSIDAQPVERPGKTRDMYSTLEVVQKGLEWEGIDTPEVLQILRTNIENKFKGRVSAFDLIQ